MKYTALHVKIMKDNSIPPIMVDSEEGPTYPYGINGCWPVANKVEVTEMETTITTPIPDC